MNRGFKAANGSAGRAIAVDDDDFIVPYWGAAAIGLARSTGVERWRIGPPEFKGVDWLPCVTQGRAYVASTSGIFALHH